MAADQCNGAKPKTSKFKENINSDSENIQKIVLEPKKDGTKGKYHESLTNKKSKTSSKHQHSILKTKDGGMLNENKGLINVICNDNKNIDDATENFENIVSPFGQSKQTAGFDKRDCQGQFPMHSLMNQGNLATKMNYKKEEIELNSVLEIGPQLEDGSPKRQFISFQKEKEYISAMERWKKSGLALRKYIAGKLGIRQNKHTKKHKLNEDMQNNVLLMNNGQSVDKRTNSDFERTFGQCKVSQDRKLVKQEYPIGSKSIEGLPCTAIKKTLPHSKSLLHYLGIKKSNERHSEQKNTVILSNGLDLCGGVDDDDDTGVSNPISNLTAGESNSNCNFTENHCSTSNSETKKKCKKVNPSQSDSSHSLTSNKIKSKFVAKKSKDIKHDKNMLVTVNNTESDESLQGYEPITEKHWWGFLDNYIDLPGEEFVHDVDADAKKISDGEDGALLRLHPALPFMPFNSSQLPNDHIVKSHKNNKDLQSESISKSKKKGSKPTKNCKKFDECPRETFREYEDRSERNINWTNWDGANNVQSNQFFKPYYPCNTYEDNRHDFTDEINKQKFGIFQDVLDSDLDDESDLNESVNKNKAEMHSVNDGRRENQNSLTKELEEWKCKLNDFDASDAFLNNDYRPAFETGPTIGPINLRNANVALCNGLLDLVRNVDESFANPCQDKFDDVIAEEDNQVTAEERRSSLLNFFSMDNIATAYLSPSNMFGPSSSSLSESPLSSTAMSTPDSLPEADDELECECVHCQLLGEHHAYLHDRDNNDVQTGFGMYPGYEFNMGIDNDIPHASYFGSLPFSDANEYQQLPHGYTDLDWLIIDSTPISVMLEDVIQQMLAVQPELLNEHACAPAAAKVIDNLPTIELNVSHIEQHPTCPVCLCASEIAEIMSILPCQHIFHPICIQAWLVKSGTCPVCRQSV